jgi:aminopeptidase N
VFTNREGEWSAVVDSIRNVAAAVADPGFDPEDVESPRRNVLSFYGVGGVGKTTLSRRIQLQLADSSAGVSQWVAPDPPLPRMLPVGIDLSRQGGMDNPSATAYNVDRCVDRPQFSAPMLLGD